MSEEQQRFDDLMKRVIKVSPEELKRRLEKSKTIKEAPLGDKQEPICKAIRGRNYVRLFYNDDSPRWHIVEPYTLGYNHSGNLILSGWFWKGTIGQLDSQGLRDYLIDAITSMEILEQTFDRPQSGYTPMGQQFQNVVCDLLISGRSFDSSAATPSK